MSTQLRASRWPQSGFTAGVFLLAAVGLAGCGGGGEDSTVGYVTVPGGEPTRIVINNPAQIAQVSADDYDQNVNGLITGTTLQRWIDDWPTNRPAGITGRLIILQVSAAQSNKVYSANGCGAADPIAIDVDGALVRLISQTQGTRTIEVPYLVNTNCDYVDAHGAVVSEANRVKGGAVATVPAANAYITPKPADGVLTYNVPSSRLTMSRSNGVTTTRSMVPDGTTMDAFLSDYGIDPTRDMLVCAMGVGGGGQAMSMGRCWYMLRYWGVEANHLAQLNGGATSPLVMDPAYLGPTATCDEAVSDACLPRSGYISVRNLPQDNTALQATLSDVIDVAEGRAPAFLWDARNEPQYLGTGFQNNNSRAGHPNGAVLLEYSKLLMGADNSWRYKDKADLAAYLNGETVDGIQFGGYDAGAVIPLGVGNAYRGGDIITYCETTFRAMITGTAAGVILGKPVRYYDGAMVEWNSMSGVPDQNGHDILPVDSPWRTDTLARSVFIYNSDPSTIEPRQIDDPYYQADKARPRADAIILADKDYKRGGGGGDDTGGAALPPNACGG